MGAVALVLLTAACGSSVPPAIGASTPTPSLGSLTEADVAFIRARASLFSVESAASVEAVRAPGSKVFELLLPDTRFGADPQRYLTHDLLVVRSLTDPPQTQLHVAYGSTPGAVTGIEEIFDTTDGSEVGGIIATSPGGVSLPDPAALGPVTTVPLRS